MEAGLRVFVYQTAENSQSFMPPEAPGAGKPFDQLRGHRLEPGSWSAVGVKGVTDGSGGSQRTDFATVWVEPALSSRAAAGLTTLVSSCAQLLPLETDLGEYFVLNVLVLPEALDEAASDLERFETGRVMRVKRHVFRPEIIRGVPAFKIPQLPRAPVFLSQEFVNSVRDLDLTGLDPILVWQA